ncbi:MAG TPA: DUF4124 domain-containing protein [Rhodanobacteraceae bacterium]|nr:DUF4124 domain-containing protein [Rhodanobacteraceae bacterium]
MKAAFAAVVILVCAIWCTDARAQVYQCTPVHGAVSFQDHPCPHGQRQKIIDLPSRPPSGYVPPPVATAAPPASITNPLSSPPQVAPPSPLPAMYTCVGAVNGKHYLTRSPPRPYLAPLGVMGYPPQTLAQEYGPPGGAGMSAPEVSKPRIGGPPIATGMTEVQDFCLPATRAQMCRFVQHEYDENHRKLRMAMSHEQPPLEQREGELQEQLRNCR